MKNDNHILKSTIKQFKETLCAEFSQKGNISAVTRKLAVFIDNVLITLFEKNRLGQGEHFCLLALGSYGRRELQLHSDIDLLLLYTGKTSKTLLNRAQNFIQDCWDIGLEVSHQITTVHSCASLASQDLSVISSIMDMFLLCGRGALMEELIYQTHPLHMWPSHEYFFAKQQEQKNRYAKYGETAYNLEPNVKYGPGGLRDLHILLSISKRHFNVKKLADGINYGFITDKEYEELIYCQHFLWKVRFALHMLAEKPEERLSFDYQVKLAQVFGYQDESHSLAIEQFMKDYFKVIKRNRELNEMLLQWFDETIVHHQKQKLTPLDNEFQLSNNYIEIRNARIFNHNPQALLKLFLWIAQRPDIDGVRASTIRLIRESLYLMNRRFRASPEATETFLNILKTGYDPYEALQRMNRYGVLAHYLDCFAAVTGQMQYDLFHVYTVDQHTLFVIRNIARFKQKHYEKQFPLCAKVINSLDKPEILYLSALFHDIAKGRGGDHSELGAVEAQQFAQRHHIEQADTELLVWLVRYHLLMSQTAQRQDIYDPKTIERFCQLLPQSRYLDYLYLLTVADICGTNPSLWNAWKDSLLKELYNAAKHVLQKEQKLMDETALISSRKQHALNILVSEGTSPDAINTLWDQFKGKYFLHESPEVIARHTKAILTTKQFPLVMIMPHHSQGGTEVFIYMPHRDERFTITTSVLSNHHVTIQEAAIITCDNQFDLDAYVILDEQNQAFFDEHRTAEIQKDLCFHLGNHNNLPPVSRKRLSRALAHFNVKTLITYNEDELHQHTRMFLIASDRPGLLATVSRVFLDLSIHLHNAKIATAGERAEDTFYVTNHENKPLDSTEKEILRQKLSEALSNSTV
ncbi:[protein-PII] uridylyltransferase [Legionella fallonii]|uniref:Bifunctional uridylyltransferase/uridylyl-removing enzyme n=1 Tax=Legionella fallonii LLAP-10 TaxID=1212491 RepID=A0A098G590_9GAMM|nr:[protein-PII] uridylyltransferase [Legionella fallonii]CEG57146.1 Bifunctional uridylyltransferase/uridylyl-removing enzyme [Includes: [Protein-PII] uridylyltransferase; [Protein-PII]-UMP uridylyl-removing enzyme] [Legionella fallonii LLAP-10]